MNKGWGWRHLDWQISACMSRCCIHHVAVLYNTAKSILFLPTSLFHPRCICWCFFTKTIDGHSNWQNLLIRVLPQLGMQIVWVVYRLEINSLREICMDNFEWRQMWIIVALGQIFSFLSLKLLAAILTPLVTLPNFTLKLHLNNTLPLSLTIMSTFSSDIQKLTHSDLPTKTRSRRHDPFSRRSEILRDENSTQTAHIFYKADWVIRAQLAMHQLPVVNTSCCRQCFTMRVKVS